MSSTRKRVRVAGRVQGVGYRASCRVAAEARGVAGWVRNCADGSVEAVFEGPAEAVEAMVRWCAAGPRWADVSVVDTVEEPPEGLSGFRVR